MASPIKFGTDGWRAAIAEEYTFDNVRLVAQAVADYVQETGQANSGLVVGYDRRFASENFAAAVAEVLTANGVPTLLTTSPTPTPVVSYSILDRHAGGGVVITASHNPWTDNGFKYKPDYAGSASPEIVAQLENHIERLAAAGRPIQRGTLEDARSAGLLDEIDAAAPYLEHLHELVDLDAIKRAGLTIVVDCMYGAGIGYFPALLEGGISRIIQINAERNPWFGGISPEPIAKNLAKLMKLVRESGSAVGVALDGDADRVGLVDEHGNFINQLQVFALLTLYLLEVRGWRGGLVKSISTTSMIDKLGELYQVPVYETPVGFKYIGPKMLEGDVIIGGEESGGFGFKHHIPERDGILAGLFLIDMIIRTGKSVSELVRYLQDKVGPFFYNRVDLHFPAEEREQIIERIRSHPPRQLDGSPVVDASTLDGYKYFAQDGSWLLIRFSGTEPIMRIYTETTAPDRVDRILADGRALVGV